jgi:hypothetical protein
VKADRRRKGQHQHGKINCQDVSSQINLEELFGLVFETPSSSGTTHGYGYPSNSQRPAIPRPQRSTLEAPSTLHRIRSWSEAARIVNSAVQPAGFVAGSGCRVLVTGARVFECRLAERQVFGVLYSHQTYGSDRAPQQVPITTAVLSALTTSRFGAVLSKAARGSGVVMRRDTGRWLESCTHIKSLLAGSIGRLKKSRLPLPCYPPWPCVDSK